MTLPAAVLTYVWLLAWPFAAGPVHPLAFVTTLKSPQFYGPAILLVLLAAAWVLAAIGTPRRGLYCFCLFWIALTLSPVLMLSAHVPEFMIQDRWLYIPTFGWSLMVAIALTGFARRRAAARYSVAAAVVLYGAVCGFALWHVQGFWKNDYAFYTRCVQLAPDDAVYHDGLGWGFLDRGDLNRAEREFAMACRLDPAYKMAAQDLATVRAFMGHAQGRGSQ